MDVSLKLDFPVLCFFGCSSVRRYDTAVELFEVWPAKALLQSLSQDGWTLVDSSGRVCSFKSARLLPARRLVSRLLGVKSLLPVEPSQRSGNLMEEKKRLVDTIHTELGNDLDFEDSTLAG